MRDAPAAAAFGLHLPRGHVGAAQKGADILGRVRTAAGDADRHSDTTGVRHILEQAPGAQGIRAFGRCQMVHAVLPHREFVRADTRDDIAGSNDGLQLRGKAQQHAIPACSAQCDIDAPQIIDIDQQQDQPN